MSTLQRYLKKPILKDLKKKMVFLGGPRQVGKTFFSQKILSQAYDEPISYLN